jgi:hypothetical protein
VPPTIVYQKTAHMNSSPLKSRAKKTSKPKLHTWRHGAQWRGQQGGRAASHEAPPLAYLLEHSASRHASSVAHAWSGHGGWMLRCRRSVQWRRSGEGGQRSEDGVWKADNTVEAERSREIFLASGRMDALAQRYRTPKVFHVSIMQTILIYDYK